ncbi:MAG: hypothetical protein AAFN79_10990 [Pseudomonadota bacterium]
MPSINSKLLLRDAYDHLRGIIDQQEVDLDKTSLAIGKSRRYLAHTLDRGSEMGFVTYFMMCREIGVDPLAPVNVEKPLTAMPRQSPFPEDKIGDLLFHITRFLREQREAEEPPTIDQALHYWREAGRRFDLIHNHLQLYCDVYAPPDEDDTLNPLIIGARSMTREILKTGDVGVYRANLAAAERSISVEAARNQRLARAKGYFMTTKQLKSDLHDGRTLAIEYDQLSLSCETDEDGPVIAVFPKYIGPYTQ